MKSCVKNVLEILLFINELFSVQLIEFNSSTVELRLFIRTNKTHPIYVSDNILNKDLHGFCSDETCVNYIIIHGYRVFFHFIFQLFVFYFLMEYYIMIKASTHSKWVIEMKDELFKSNKDINVFTINWSSRGMYVNVIKKLSDTSKEIFQILNHLSQNGLFIRTNNQINIHCIGHSLGKFHPLQN